jgi:tRNA threonylcarbamoyladenosine biosynthesis protein TsaB
LKVLAIDTSTTRISVAIVEDATILVEREDTVAKNRTGVLPLIDAAFADIGMPPRAIDAVAVGAGPGSFTGLRIGMATAKGIAFAAQRPLWAVSSLAALVEPELARDPGGLVVGVIDARRGEVYAGAYRAEGGRIVLAGDERVLPPAELDALVAGVRQVNETVRFVGVADGIGETTPRAASVARLALAGTHVDVLVGGAPSYIRASEAEIRYPDGVPGALRKR